MNDILSETAKSFRLIRPKIKNEYKSLVTYTKKMTNCLYFPIVENEEEIFTALFNLFGPMGARKSFYRYYFPRRFFWTSTLYIRPRVMQFVDEKAKKKLVMKHMPGFRGTPRNKLLDKRNLIVDYTDIVKLLIPRERSLITKINVVNYVEKIIPEILCYILFDNTKHDKKNDIEEDESTEIYNNKSLYNHIKKGSDLFDIRRDPNDVDVDLATGFSDTPEDEWTDLMTKSSESFDEHLFSKTKIFTMGGPAIGINKYGYDKFIIAFPMKLTMHKFFSPQYLSGQMKLIRSIKTNPELIYQVSYLRFIYKCYEAYCKGSGDDDFVNEIIKHNISFHIYANNGTGFVLNFKELKNDLKYKPQRFLKMFQSRLQLLAMVNVGTINEVDLDKLDEEIEDKEFEQVNTSVVNKAQDDSKYNLKKQLEEDLTPIVKNDLVLQTVSNSKKIKVTKVIKSPDEIEDKSNATGMIPGVTALVNSDDAKKELQKVYDKFNTNTIIKNETEGEVDFELSEIDYKAIFEDDSDDVIEDEEEETKPTIIEDIIESRTLVEMEDQKDVNNDSIDDFVEEFNEADEEVVEVEEEEDYVEVKPTKSTRKKGPVKLSEYKPVTIKRTPAEEKRLDALKDKYKSLKIGNQSIEEIIGNSANIEIESSVDLGSKKPVTNDANVTKLNATDVRKSYVKNNYQSDIINAVRSLSVNKEIPFYIADVNVEDTSTRFDDKLTYEFKLEDEFKNKHNLKFDVPKLQDNGIMKMGGSEQYLNNQLLRKPIVKTKDDQVYITTGLNRYIVYREGMILNKGSEIVRRLFNEYLPGKANVKIERGNCESENTSYITTLEYDLLAKNFFFIRINDENAKFGEHVEFHFSQKRIREKIKKLNINTGFKDNIIPNNILPIGINYTSNSIYSVDTNGNQSINSTIVMLLNELLLDKEMIDFISNIKTPKRRVRTWVEIQSHKSPMIIFLGFLFGWDKVISYFPESGVEFSKDKLKNNNKLSIKFYDGYLYYNQYPLNGAMLINGLTDVKTENYHYADLNNPNFYMDYALKVYKSRNIIKGWNTCKESMLDFKTLQILEALELPTDFLEIYLYCNELIVDNQVKDESDISNYRIRNNEIIVECLYKVINDQYNLYKKKSGKRVSMTIPQNAVMSKVWKTNILKSYDNISPVAEIRELGLTTFKGPGGTKLEQAFTTQKRAYDESYFGVFSMSTPDNANAGVVKELTLNTKIENTLGFIAPQDKDNYSLNDIASIAEALTPFVNKMDDPNRVAFTSTQNAHVGGLPDASLPIVRTGVEKVVQYQTSENFVKLAPKDGTVTQIDEVGKKMYVTYKDNTKDVIDYNNRMLKNSDAFNEATYEAYIKEGAKFKRGDTLVADSRFFKVDPISKELVYTQAKNALVAIMEGGYTEEDSSLITETFSGSLKMNFSMRKQITIDARDTVVEYKKIGDYVKLGDPIFVFDGSGTFEEDQDSEESNIFDELFSELESSQLSQMIHQTPKANLTGTIKDMRIYWTCPISEMSKTVAKLVKEYISRIKKEIMEEEQFSNRPSPKRNLIEITKVDPMRNSINGKLIDHKRGILIEYYTSQDDEMSIGDKISLNSSLKTITAHVVEKDREPYTESGVKLDGIFSWISSQARMVNSWIVNGFLGKILYDFSKRWARDFLKEIGEPVPKNRREIDI